ncbi:MAG: thrombospondin type 3 repeat-containing protein [Candidatus Rokubacteria bacterium]|nr:thrombospondin type 3 repeat-containing protein [Candidatus Rokubacteria bacterium]
MNASTPRAQYLHLSLLCLSLVTTCLIPASRATAQGAGGPSAFCHVTDGTFTNCPGGGREWSDVPVRAFPQTQSFLYASQADLNPARGNPLDTFVLMYDECSRRVPLGPDEYFRVFFRTVETEAGAEKLEHYVLHLFTDGTILFIEDGVVQSPGRATVVHGMRGKVGFGRSPNCAFDHVIAEFQVPLSITGSSYSPDPLFWGASVPPPPPPPCQPGDIRLPTLINVLKGVTVSDSTLQDMVDRSNAILSQASICSDSGGGNIIRDASDQGNNDGKVSLAEMNGNNNGKNLETACGGELNRNFNGGKGIKVIMANEVLDPETGGANFAGVSQCVYLTPEGDLGYKLAHELGHAFGIAPGAPIGDEQVDETGHFGGPENLMDPKSGGGTELTEGQIEVIQRGARRVSANTEHGGFTDDVGDVALRRIDLTVGTLFAESLSSDLEITIRVAGTHPAGSAVTERFELLLDTDNNSATGGVIGSHRGIDKVLRVALSGRFPFTPPNGSITASLRDVLTGAVTPLPPGSVSRVPLIVERFSGPTPPGVLNAGDVIRQTVPMPALDLRVRAVPVIVRATDVPSSQSDEAAFVFQLTGAPGLGAIRPGFNAASLARNDDGSSPLVPLGFTVNFFGVPFSGLFVNNNGNVTFDAPLPTFTPFGFISTQRKIIAPFFADVDTRVGNVVTFGAGTVDGRPAFGANWPGVGCFNRNASVLNFFQVLLISRADIAPGDFDIEFNYDSIQWEAGEASGGNTACLGGTVARAGFSNGSGLPGTFFELPGSGVVGAFLDSNLATGLIHRNLNADRSGRHVLRIRSGEPAPERDRDADGVLDDLDNCPTVANADQRDSNLNGIGDACDTPGIVNSTAAFMQANFDGTTAVEPLPLLVSQEPSLQQQLVRIVDFRLDAGLASSAEETTENLVASLVDLNLVQPQDAGALIDAVVGQVTEPPLRGDIDRDGDVDSADLALLLAERNRLVGQSTCGLPCDLDNDGKISALDGRILVTLCTRTRCAAQ